MTSQSVFAATGGMRVSPSEAAYVMEIDEALVRRWIGAGRFHAVLSSGDWEIPSQEVLDAAMSGDRAGRLGRFPGPMPATAYEGEIEDFMVPPRCVACASAHWVCAPERNSCPPDLEQDR
jgi:hypothetical protein